MSEPFTCPHCKNPISDDEALLCHFCGESLRRPSSGALGKLRYSGPSALLVCGIIMLIFAFILLYTLF